MRCNVMPGCTASTGVRCSAGALKQLTGQESYNAAKGVFVKESHWYQSKVGAP